MEVVKETDLREFAGNDSEEQEIVVQRCLVYGYILI